MASTLTGFPPDVRLSGVEAPAAPPVRSRSAWWAGTLQSEFDAWLPPRIGLRGVLVRTANQIHYSLFGELAQGRGTKVVPGREGFLFEKVYVDTYQRQNQRSGSEGKDISTSTRRLQDRLAEDGIAFLLVIAPSKAEIYPEYLPEEADVAGRPARRSAYEDMIGHLREDGVNVVDAHDLFLQWKGEAGTPPLFTRGGTHWNHYGASRIVSTVMDRLRDLTGKDLPTIQVVGAVTNRTVESPDNDLGELANLWSVRSMVWPQIHPVVESRPGTYLADLLFICDSFGAVLIEQMNHYRLYRNQDAYFYYSRHFFWPRRRDSAVWLDEQKGNLLQVVRSRDAVVIVEVEHFLPHIGFGFVRDLLRAYEAEDALAAADAS